MQVQAWTCPHSLVAPCFSTPAQVPALLPVAYLLTEGLHECLLCWALGTQQ